MQQAVDVIGVVFPKDAALTLHGFKERLHNPLDEKLRAITLQKLKPLRKSLQLKIVVLWHNLWELPYIHAPFQLFPAQLLGNPAGDKPWAQWAFDVIHCGSQYSTNTGLVPWWCQERFGLCVNGWGNETLSFLSHYCML